MIVGVVVGVVEAAGNVEVGVSGTAVFVGLGPG